VLATAFILKRKASFLLLYSLHYYMSGKNSKTPIALGLLTTIFLFQRLNWLFFNDSIGFFCTTQLAFFARLNWLFSTIQLAFQRFNWFFNDSIGFSPHHLAFNDSIGFLTIQLAFLDDSISFFRRLNWLFLDDSIGFF